MSEVMETAKRVTLRQPIEDVAATEESSRYAIGNVMVLHSWAVATNGRICAAVRVEDHQVPSRTMIPASAVARMRKLIRRDHRKAGPTQVEVAVDGNALQVRGPQGLVVETEAGDGRFPHLSEVLPSVSEHAHLMVRLNAELLYKLARAVTTDDELPEVTLFLPIDPEREPTSKCATIGVFGPEGIGALMPVANETGVTPEYYRTRYQAMRDSFAQADRREDPQSTETA